MKKTLLISIILGIFLPLHGQDTIYNRCDHYLYSNWYDTCMYYYKPYNTNYTDHGVCFTLSYHAPAAMEIYAKPEYTSEPVAIQGIAVMESYYRDVHYVASSADTGHLDEYTMLYKWDNARRTMVTLDSVRWDTVPAKIMKLPLMADTDLYGFATCNVHETFFDSAIIVTDSFFLGGTSRSNYTMPNNGWYPYTPTVYAYILTMLGSNGCPTNNMLWCWCQSESLEWHWINTYVFSDYGMFMPIVYYADLGVESADSTMGSVTPGGRHSIMVDQTIRALPGEGYRFSHWNDGNTANPRIIRLMQDTLFTAYFVSDTVPDDTTGGGTTGDDTTGGTEFILLPDGQSPAFRLSPNPATGTVAIQGATEQIESVRIFDMAGRQVSAFGPAATFDISHLPAGSYIVRIQSADHPDQHLRLIKE